MATFGDYRDGVGIAGFDSQDVPGQVELFAGETPAPVTVSAKYTGAQGTAGIPAFTPVQVNFETDTIVAVDGTTVTKANAITCVTVKAGSPAGEVPVFKAGCFNINALRWPTSLATEAARLGGFNLASCQIYIKKPYYS